jgi:hypothetical protein
VLGPLNSLVWWQVPGSLLNEFGKYAGSLLNEFAMMWELRERFRGPLHFIVFKQTVCRLSHEANVEQVYFSRAGNLSHPNMDPEYLTHLVIVGVNKKSQ